MGKKNGRPPEQPPEIESRTGNYSLAQIASAISVVVVLPPMS